MLPDELIKALAGARKTLPGATWSSLEKSVEREAGAITQLGIIRVVAGVMNPNVKWDLQEGFCGAIGSSWTDIGLVMRTLDHCTTSGERTLEMVWSGPSSPSQTARRIDQILYDLLAQAKQRVFLITFSAYKVARLRDSLDCAHHRGVKITLLLETARDSEGQLSNDALNAFSGLPLAEFEILHWPRDQRELNNAGNPGKLHAKCAVIDDAVVISSANLTDDAFNRNMEMGVVAHDTALADSLLRHFEELKASKILKKF